MNLDYLTKTDKAIDENIFWNVPEQKSGILQVVGGNANSFSFEIKQAEFLNSLNLKEVRLLLPDTLRTKIPPIPGINFAPSTESGSFKKSDELNFAMNDADLIYLSGDFSKNSETSIALVEAIKKTTSSLVLTKDSIDLVSESAEEFIERENLTFIATSSQLQKLFKNLYYPKMILLSSPLLPVVEALHKFTLSYPVTILTYHAENIIVARAGKVITTPLEKTNYSPLSLFMGDLAAKVSALTLWSPAEKRLEATHSALFFEK
ncbi:MAG: hypothetical protein Q4E70_02760 [Candidatus Saccharibacteria bacterium]|nr:hypothetical protein [Candidatus Saccharibacteria bacterium]